MKKSAEATKPMVSRLLSEGLQKKPNMGLVSIGSLIRKGVPDREEGDLGGDKNAKNAERVCNFADISLMAP